MRYIETDLLQQYKQAGRKSLKKKEKRVWMRSSADPARKKGVKRFAGFQKNYY